MLSFYVAVILFHKACSKI